jgi:hypothetical protein
MTIFCSFPKIKDLGKTGTSRCLPLSGPAARRDARRLAAPATASGRTLSEEAVRLIDYGLHSQTLLEQAIKLSFGPEITGDLMMIGRIMQDAVSAPTSAGAPTDATDWSEAPEAFDRVAKAVATYFEQRNPRGAMLPNERRD